MKNSLDFSDKSCNTTTNRDLTTIKLWKCTLLNLRLLSAYSGKRMVEILDVVIREALEREVGGEVNRSCGSKVR